MTSNRVLRVRGPLTDDEPERFRADVSDVASGYSRSIRRNGGFWLGDFTITADKWTQAELADFFYTNLGYVFEENSSGLITWRGIIYEMDLTIGGTTLRRTLDLMENVVAARYVNDDGEPISITGSSNDTSVSRYGRKENILRYDDLSASSAQALVDTRLSEHGWPWARPVGGGKADQKDKLEVTLAGISHTANWQYLSQADLFVEDASAYITDIADNDLEFIGSQGVRANTLQVYRKARQDTRAWDTIMKVTEMGDADGNPWRVWVNVDDQLVYEQIDPTPIYYLRDGKLYSTIEATGPVNIWSVNPGVVRDLTFPQDRAQYQSWLNDHRDFYIPQVEAGDGGLSFKTDYFSESEALAQYIKYQQMLEEENKK